MRNRLCEEVEVLLFYLSHHNSSSPNRQFISPCKLRKLPFNLRLSSNSKAQTLQPPLHPPLHPPLQPPLQRRSSQLFNKVLQFRKRRNLSLLKHPLPRLRKLYSKINPRPSKHLRLRLHNHSSNRSLKNNKQLINRPPIHRPLNHSSRQICCKFNGHNSRNSNLHRINRRLRLAAKDCPHFCSSNSRRNGRSSNFTSNSLRRRNRYEGENNFLAFLICSLDQTRLTPSHQNFFSFIHPPNIKSIFKICCARQKKLTIPSRKNFSFWHMFGLKKMALLFTSCTCQRLKQKPNQAYTLIEHAQRAGRSAKVDWSKLPPVNIIHRFVNIIHRLTIEKIISQINARDCKQEYVNQEQVYCVQHTSKHSEMFFNALFKAWNF